MYRLALIVACLFSTGPLFSHPFSEKKPVKNPSQERKNFLSGGVLYWNIAQEGMDIGYQTYKLQGYKTVQQPTEYTTGFVLKWERILSHDNWRFSTEYKRISYKTQLQKVLDTSETFTFPWHALYFTTNVSATIQGGSTCSTWKLSLDWVDLQLSRSFQLTKKILTQPGFGMRFYRLPQELSFITSGANRGGQNGEQRFQSTCVAIGPFIGMDTHFFFGNGVFLNIGHSGSLALTHYTFEQKQQLLHDDSSPGSFFHPKTPRLATIRPMASLGIGLGWEGALSDTVSFKVTAKHDFNLFFNQNMLRYISSFERTPYTPGNLTMHGLTLTGEVQF